MKIQSIISRYNCIGLQLVSLNSCLYRMANSRVSYHPVCLDNENHQDHLLRRTDPVENSYDASKENFQTNKSGPARVTMAQADELQGGERKFVRMYNVDANNSINSHDTKSRAVSRPSGPLFLIINILIFAFGFANFGMGLWFRIDPKVYEVHKFLETQNMTIAGWLLLFGGFSVCLASIVGCILCFLQLRWPLAYWIYVVLMTFLIIGFIGTLVLLSVHGLGDPLEHYLVKEIHEHIRRKSINTDFNQNSMGDSTQYLDFLQVKMRCCGALDFRDYVKLGMTVPATCYTIDKNYISAPGCGHAMRMLFDIRAGMAIAFTSVAIALQLVAIALSFLLIQTFKSSKASENRPEVVVSYDPQVNRIDSLAALYSRPPHSRAPIVM